MDLKSRKQGRPFKRRVQGLGGQVTTPKVVITSWGSKKGQTKGLQEVLQNQLIMGRRGGVNQRLLNWLSVGK